MSFEITLRGKGLAAALVLGCGAVLALASVAAQGIGPTPAASPAMIQNIIEARDHVSAAELAHWIIDKKTHYQLIDLREPWEFDDYHIPTAINLPLGRLFQSLDKLDRSKQIVVYGLGMGHPAQTQLLLSMKGYNAFSLRDGITAWWDEVMTPQSMRGESPNPSGYQQARALRERFSGGPASTRPTGAAAPAPALPGDAGSTGSGGAPRKRLKLGRGCS